MVTTDYVTVVLTRDRPELEGEAVLIKIYNEILAAWVRE